jgi:hypothetical protein
VLEFIKDEQIIPKNFDLNETEAHLIKKTMKFASLIIDES